MTNLATFEELGINPLSREEFLRALPKNYSGQVSDELIQDINQVLVDPNLRENFKENLVTYVSVLTKGNLSLKRYIEAVKFVSYKLMNMSSVEAYSKVFPDRYKRLLDENTSDSQIASFAAAYNRTQLVTSILEQTLIPTHILNAGLYQEAINTNAHLMRTANSELVRQKAASDLMNALAPPVAAKVEMNIGVKDNDTISELKTVIAELSEVQRKQIQNGYATAKQVAGSRIIQGEVVNG